MIERKCYTLPNSNNKARVFKDSDGDEFLYSYDTPVLLNHNGKLYRLWNGWTATTGRHIKEYCGLNKKQYLELEYKWFDSKFKNKWIGFDSKFKNKSEYQKMKAKYEAQFKIVRKNALANPNLYDGRFTQKDIRKARKEYLDLITNRSIKKWKPKR